MPFFVKKPIKVEARKYSRNGILAEDVTKWCGGTQTDDGCVIHTLEGDMLADYGDMIIKGVNGEFYPCKPDVFSKTYEEVSS